MMQFPSPLVRGTLVQRYKRFFADVTLESGETIVAHCANTGTMKTCGTAGDTVYLLHNPDPKRKLAYSWELTATPLGFVGVNTARPNQVVAAAVEAGHIAELSGYTAVRREVKYGANSRIDLLLQGPGRPDCYVEIKNSTLLGGDSVLFPDAVTSRGLKHLHELQAVVAQGGRAVMLYFVNRPEGKDFGVADTVDPAYGSGLRAAMAAGVEVLAYRAEHSLTGIKIGAAVPVSLA